MPARSDKRTERLSAFGRRGKLDSNEHTCLRLAPSVSCSVADPDGRSPLERSQRLA